MRLLSVLWAKYPFILNDLGSQSHDFSSKVVHLGASKYDLNHGEGF